VLALEDIPDNLQIQHNETVYEVEHPTAGRMRQCRPAPIFSRTQAERGTIAPLFGEHTDEILDEAGFSPEKIAAMREAGSIG
jgi:crotonobetainyl-CoA:carnitine CoA-transferase CaiB-like acyl-CoA transferase